MDRAALRDLARARLDDTVLPYGFPDTLIDGFLDEAAEEAAIRARLLYPTGWTAALAIGVATSDLDTEVIAISRVVLRGHGPLVGLSSASLDREYLNWESRGTGRPTHYLTDELPTLIRVWPAPDEAVTLDIQGYRLPLPMEEDTDEPEIAAIHHRNLIDWVLHRAYQQRDTDDFNIEASDRALARFTANFGPRPTAKALYLEQRARPMEIIPHARYVS